MFWEIVKLALELIAFSMMVRWLANVATKSASRRRARRIAMASQRKAFESAKPQHFNCRCAIDTPASPKSMPCWVSLDGEKTHFFITPRDRRAWGQPSDQGMN